jgi:hypothetical protein
MRRLFTELPRARESVGKLPIGPIGGTEPGSKGKKVLSASKTGSCKGHEGGNSLRSSRKLGFRCEAFSETPSDSAKAFRRDSN